MTGPPRHQPGPRSPRRLRPPAALTAGALALALSIAAPAAAAPATGGGDAGFRLTELATLERPIFADDAPGTKGHLYVAEQSGVVRVLHGDTVLPRPFLDISDLVGCCGEEGLLSFAFHPGYARNRLLYVYFTDRQGDLALLELKRHKRKRFVATRSSAREVLRIPHPVNANHNGGTIRFGPDGRLYIATGDGGSFNDPPDNAQNRQSLLGKLLRIDPRRQRSGRRRGIPRSNPFVGRPGRDEIYALGLRNPFRFSFDSLKGSIAIGDVGQGCREEINYMKAGRARGVNFGWSGWEGNRLHLPERAVPDPVFPILEYDNSNALAYCPPLGSAFTGASVMPGHVVRDKRIPAQYGRLIYTDVVDPQLRSLIPAASGAGDDQFTGLTVPAGAVFAFAEGYRGRVYVVSGTGPVYRLDPV